MPIILPRIGQPPIEWVSNPRVWSFMQLGIDLVGPLPRSTRQWKWIIVVIDYFSKWFEANTLAPTTEFQVIKFLKSRIILWYGVPHVLVSDNGPQFVGKDIK